MNKQAYAHMEIVDNEKAKFVRVTDSALNDTYSDHLSTHFSSFAKGTQVFVNYSIGESGRRTILSVTEYNGDAHDGYFRTEKNIVVELNDGYDEVNGTFAKHWDSTVKRLISLGVNFIDEDEVKFSNLSDTLKKNRRIIIKANISDHEIGIISRIANIANLTISSDGSTSVPAEEISAIMKRQPHPAINGYYIDPTIAMVFTTVKNSLGEKPVKTLITGPSGYGKTTLPTVFSNILGHNCIRMNCAQIRDPEEWFGYREAIGGETVFVKSPFIEAITAGNCVVILDEWNRLAPDLKNTLYPLLDDSAATQIHGHEFVVGENVSFFATVNVGAQYVGTYEMDFAELNRFQFIVEVGPIPKHEEVNVLAIRTGISKKDASTIVKTISDLRDKHGNLADFSVRTSLQIAKAVAAGADMRFAFQAVVVNRVFDTGYSNNRKVVIDTINMNLGMFSVDDVKKSIFFIDSIDE